VKRDLQEQEVSKVKSLQEALNYEHLYEQSLQQPQLKEINQLLQEEYARLNDMARLQQENIF
jgi:siroheme synthase